MKQAVILAGGKGTRLRERLGNKPKPLVDVCGLPLLLRQLQKLADFGFEQAIILVNHRADAIEHYIESTALRIQCRIIDDGRPRGTAGAVLAIMEELEETFLVVYGDTLFDVDLDRFLRFHQTMRSAASLLVHPNDHPEDSDLVELDDEQKILAFHNYPHPTQSWYPNLVNAAMYFVQKSTLTEYKSWTPPLDFAKDLFPRMIREGKALAGYVSSEYIKDIGTPERLDKAEAAMRRGVVERASFRFAQRAVFIDRDGTVNQPNGHIARPEDLSVFPFVPKALRRLNDSDYRTVLVTNQPVVARGEATLAQLRRIHGRLDSEVATEKSYFDAKYICPHHPDKGFAGEIASLKVSCNCRKPSPGLVLRAIEEMNIDPRKSWLIGDSTADFGAATNAGIRSIGVRTGDGCQDARYPFQPDIIVDDFSAAVDYILEATNDH